MSRKTPGRMETTEIKYNYEEAKKSKEFLELRAIFPTGDQNRLVELLYITKGNVSEAVELYLKEQELHSKDARPFQNEL